MASTNTDVDIPSDSVPQELKSTCEQILKRARELRKADPVMSYWCCFSAANSAMNFTSRSAEGTQFLIKILDVLELMKSSLINNPTIESSTITDESAGSAYVENFAIKVFLQADDEDRASKANKSTIRKFVVASQFIEVLRSFEAPFGMREEMEQKLQYARWKAADIAKALKEGRQPTAGPPGGDVPNPLDELMPPPQKQSSTTRSEAQPILPSLPQDIHQDILHAPVRQNSIGSGAWSTVATPGLREENDVEMAFAGATPDDPPRSGMDLDKSQGDKPTDSPSQRKNVRFAGPDGAPLSPAGTFVSLDSYVSPGGPPPTVFGDLNEKQGANTSGMTGTFMDDESRDEASAPTIAVTGKPLPSAPSLIPSPSTQTERGVASAVVPTPTANTVFTASTNEVINLDSKSIEICQKHCKWAISALDYEDMDTARAELRKALAMLGG